jgi:acyl-coenzyme A thioesterase PaaI-like protein
MPASASKMTSPNDHRAAARFDTALPVDVEGMQATGRNISSTGVYFETAVDLPLGSVLNLNVQFTQGGRKHWLACEGRVVRVTQAGGQHGVAAELLTPFFSPEEEQYVAKAATRR